MKLAYFLCPYLGTPLVRSPVLGHRDLDLYKLYKIVSKMNGMDKVPCLQTVLYIERCQYLYIFYWHAHVVAELKSSQFMVCLL